jgi:glycosyltransferase involved in cell wall biosynthesis
LQNCVDTEEFTKDPESGLQARCELGLGDKFTFIHVGRLEYPKDVSTVLNAFVDVVRRAPAYLLVVGDGPDRKHLEQQAGALGLNGSVKFLGRRNDVASLMNAADCLVLSSAWEGLPLTILEAMACGLPVITTRYQGADELVGCAGLVVPGRNPEALAASMVCVQKKIAGYGSVGRRLVEDKYSVDHVCRKWESIYYSIALQQVLVPTLRHPGGA